MQVEIWSDVVCPWCYIGKRRFERAAAELADEVDLQVTYRPYQLDPTAKPGVAMPVFQAYSRKFGGPERAAEILERLTGIAASEGLEFRMDRAQRANTLLAHRLLWLAQATGHQPALKERLLQAYFHDGLDVGDPEVLARCAEDVGMPPDRVLAFLQSDDGEAEVRDEMRRAVDAEITGVPAYVLDGLWTIPGAQDPETFVTVIRRMLERRTRSEAFQRAQANNSQQGAAG